MQEPGLRSRFGTGKTDAKLEPRLIAAAAACTFRDSLAAIQRPNSVERLANTRIFLSRTLQLPAGLYRA